MNMPKFSVRNINISKDTRRKDRKEYLYVKADYHTQEEFDKIKAIDPEIQKESFMKSVRIQNDASVEIPVTRLDDKNITPEDKLFYFMSDLMSHWATDKVHQFHGEERDKVLVEYMEFMQEKCEAAYQEFREKLNSSEK